MARPPNILSSETLTKWRRKALRRRRNKYNYDDDWAERRLLDVIRSHEGLRRGVRPPFTKPPERKDLRFKDD